MNYTKKSMLMTRYIYCDFEDLELATSLDWNKMNLLHAEVMT
jgi:hypothetical protein